MIPSDGRMPVLSSTQPVSPQPLRMEENAGTWLTVGLLPPTVPGDPEVVPVGKLENGRVPAVKLMKVALAPTRVPTMLFGPLVTVPVDEES